MTKKTPKPKPAQAPKAKTYIVYGADEYAKPRAARFSADDPELLAKAVETMHLRMTEVTGDDLAEIATKLPAGRLHANGRSLVPYIRGDLYLDLLAETMTAAQDLPPGTTLRQAMSCWLARPWNAAGGRPW
jgi:hypothetical protein